MDENLHKIFHNANTKVTRPRVEVFNALKASSTPLSIVQIIERCNAVNKVSVYRTIKLFESLNIISSITHGWKQSYELSEPFTSHHHHLTCINCSSLIELRSKSVENIIEQVSVRYNFKPLSHHFEIKGLCKNCIHDSSALGS